MIQDVRRHRPRGLNHVSVTQIIRKVILVYEALEIQGALKYGEGSGSEGQVLLCNDAF